GSGVLLEAARHAGTPAGRLALLFPVWTGDAFRPRRLVGEAAAPGAESLVLHRGEPGGGLRARESSGVPLCRGRPRFSGRRNCRPAVGRTVVLCRGSLEKPALLRRGGNGLPGLVAPAPVRAIP